MPKASTARPSTARAAGRKLARSAIETDQPSAEPRGARRKRETRARLMRAAMQLMAERGVDGVAINEITEAADVGFGSFYNHFPSKEAIYHELMSEVVDRFGEALDHLGDQVTDPAEKIAASVRYTLLRAREDPTWGRFLVRSSLAGDSMNSGLGRYLFRDLKSGLSSGRFKADDVPMTYVALGGTVLAALSTEVESGPSAGRRRASPGPFGADTKDIAQRTAAVLLRLLGLSTRESDSIAYRPLPQVTLPPSPI